MNVGIIGAGIQAKTAQLPAFSEIDGFEVIGIADINLHNAKIAAKKFNVPKIYQDYRELINDPEIELVSICTPNHLHKQMAIESAKAGKHVLIEKPMATTVRDANEIIEAAKESGIKLCVVQNYRFFPCVGEAKKRIMNGRLGRIISIHGHAHLLQTFDRSWSLDEGVIEDFGPHLIDIVFYLNSFDPVERIFAVGDNFGGHIDLIVRSQILLEFQNGSRCMLDLSWLSGAKEIAIYVQGSGGLLHMDVRNNFLREIHQYSTPIDDIQSFLSKLAVVTKDIINKSYFRGAKTYYFHLFNELLESLENNKKPPVTGEEGKMIALVIEGAYKSIREQRPILAEEILEI